MGHLQILERLRQRLQNLAWRDAVVNVLVVEIELALIEFERGNPTGIHDFQRQRLACV